MSRILESEELTKLQPIIQSAREIAEQSTCNKDHRGVVVFKNGEILGRATNGPIAIYPCQPEICSKVCGLFAMHAERLALMQALSQEKDLNGASLLHVRVRDHEIQISGPLSCDDCTGYMMRFLRKGIMLHEFILLQGGEWTAYEIKEADQVTRHNLKLDK